MTDYEEIQQYDTDPTKMDSDGDGYIDAEEVAQGTDPLDDSSNPGVVQASALLNPFRRLVGAGARSVGGGLSSFFSSGYTGAEQTATNGSLPICRWWEWLLIPFIPIPKAGIQMKTDCRTSWEITYGMDEQIANAGNDADGDGLTNLQEYTLYTNPLLADTDGDGLGDYAESQTQGTNPLLADGDGDGV